MSYWLASCISVGVVCSIFIGSVMIGLLTLAAKDFFKDFCKNR